MIKHVQFTGVWVSDSERAYDFYVNKLGFTVAHDRQFGGGHRFLMVVPPGGGAGLTVCKPLPGMTGARIGGPTTISFTADDVQATYDELTARGVEFTQPPTQQFWGGIQAVFVDPDGNEFMLSQVEA